MTDIPLPAAGDTDWNDWADEQEAVTDSVRSTALMVDTVNNRVGLAGNTAPAVPVDVGTGSDVTFYTSVAAQVARVRHGTTAAPNTTPGPTLRVSRTEQLTRAQIEAVGGVGTDGGEQCAAIIGINAGTTATEVQPVGVYGAAKTTATTAIANADACGLYGVGRAGGAGATGSGIGAFILGLRDASTAGATALELHVSNQTATDGTYNATGSSRTKGVWLNCGGGADSGVGFQFGNSSGRQFEVGIGFNGQVTGGKTGGIKTASIRDDSTSATSMAINGTHATAAIAVAPGAGKVGVGIAAPVSLLHVSGGDAEVSGTGVGVILPAPNNSRWRITVDNTGRLTTTAVA